MAAAERLAAMNIPEIPPYNPNAKKRRSEAPQPSQPPTKQARPMSAYAVPPAAPPEPRNAHRSSVYAPAPQDPVHGSLPTPGSPIPSAAESNRPRKIYFGPYQLLQTLGEGEFGKVKLGVKDDARWGEEVAIKLIKRGSIQDSQARMAKVLREIDVLKVVKHPNIVRLHDVINTEKYIGIVLEYASGGELFDHILAHRHLRDKDACKLFAQLISGVHYLHQKKIVHRDLKLENLLLDRHRNIIVTDFGFANRFHDRSDDFMTTSCGSPCYAAPELVVQDGKYVGKAVDVWSCGVILYAMLAGYLPYDDDPANPDSENINLLYKYIISTKLTFPDWVSNESRDLLLIMLVADPTKRCRLQDVMDHPWLAKYRRLFDLTVDELEEQAEAQLAEKQRTLQRRKEAILHPELFEQNNMARSQSTQVSHRHQSAVVVPTSAMQPLYAPLTARPVPANADKRRAHAQSAIVVPSASTTSVQASADVAVADPFSYSGTHLAVESIPMAPSHSAPGRSSSRSSHHERAEQQRLADEEAARKKRAQAHRYTVQVEYDGPSTPQLTEVRPSTRASKRSREPEVEEEVESLQSSLVEPAPVSTPSSRHSPTESVYASSAFGEHGHEAPRASQPSGMAIPSSPHPKPESGGTTPTGGTAKPRLPFPSPVQEKTESSAEAPSSPTKASEPRPTRASAADRFSLVRILGNPTTSTERMSKNSDGGSYHGEPLDEVTNKRKTRKKALSMVVDPFKSSTVTRKRQSARPQVTMAVEEKQKPRTRSSTAAATAAPIAPSTPSRQARKEPVPPPAATQEPSRAPGTPAGKAKRVMDWFRWKSMPKDSSLSDIAAQPASVQTDFDRPTTRLQARNSAVVQAKLRESQNAAPQVVVSLIADGRSTVDIESQPSSRSASGSESLLPAASANKRHSIAASTLDRVPLAGLTQTNSARERELAFYEARLRNHSGAVDQNALTSKKPSIVLADLLRVLQNMGIDVREETTPFRLKCTRSSSKRVAALYGVPITSVHTGGETRPDAKGAAPASSAMSPSVSLRNFFGRRNSTHSGGTLPSPALSLTTAEGPDLLHSQLSQSTSSINHQPLPFYGDNEPGGEVRFTCEISRLRNLGDLFAIDIRRLKGNLWSYRAIYCEILQQLAVDGPLMAPPTLAASS